MTFKKRGIAPVTQEPFPVKEAEKPDQNDGKNKHNKDIAKPKPAPIKK